MVNPTLNMSAEDKQRYIAQQLASKNQGDCCSGNGLKITLKQPQILK